LEIGGHEVDIMLTSTNLIILAYMMSWLQKTLTTIQTQQSEIKELQEDLKLKPLKSGVLTATGGEDVVLEYADSEPFKIQGWINLKNMAAGDVVVITQRFTLQNDTEPSIFAQRTYKDTQSQPLIHITPREILKGVKVTIQQTSGTLKSFPHEFYIGKTS
jgi:hypothetical protein